MTNVFQSLTADQRRVMFNALAERVRKADVEMKLAMAKNFNGTAVAWKTERDTAKQLLDTIHELGSVTKAKRVA